MLSIWRNRWKIFFGQNCRNIELVSKVLSDKWSINFPQGFLWNLLISTRNPNYYKVDSFLVWFASSWFDFTSILQQISILSVRRFLKHILAGFCSSINYRPWFKDYWKSFDRIIIFLVSKTWLVTSCWVVSASDQTLKEILESENNKQRFPEISAISFHIFYRHSLDKS